MKEKYLHVGQKVYIKLRKDFISHIFYFCITDYIELKIEQKINKYPKLIKCLYNLKTYAQYAYFKNLHLFR